MAVTVEDIVKVIQQTNVVEDPDKLRRDIKLTDQGIDSLDMFSVILALQEQYQIEISDEDVDRLHTIEDLQTYLNSRIT